MNDRLHQAFKPEFLNRIDDTIMFTPLSLANVTEIVGKLIQLLAKRLEIQNMTLEISASAEEWLAQKGYEPAYGARPLKRLITNEVETPLARKIIGNEVKPNDDIMIDVANDQLTFIVK